MPRFLDLDWDQHRVRKTGEWFTEGNALDEAPLVMLSHGILGLINLALRAESNHLEGIAP